MTEHTKEPWAHRNGRIYQADRDVLTIANIARASDGDYSEANARRIVKCVNYCKGLPTEGIATATALGKTAEASLHQLAEVIAQRDQLLAALETLVEAHDTDCSDTDRRWALVDARLAIAAVKG